MIAKRVLITGAQGFLGRYLAADWLVADPQVTVIGIGRSARLEESFPHAVHWGGSRVQAPLPVFVIDVLRTDRYRYLPLDMGDTPPFTQLLTDIRPDVVVHLAASLRDDPPTELVQANIRTVASLFESVSGAGLGSTRIVLGSSGAVYGHIPGRFPPFREDAACAPIDPYAVTKWAAEILGSLLADQYRVSTLWARIFNLVGPGQHERHLSSWLGHQIAAIASGMQLPIVSVGPLDTTRDFIDARDTAAAIRLIATRGEPGATYNVASGQETSGQQVFDTLLDLAGLTGRVSVEHRPGRPADMRRHYADVTRLVTLGYSHRYSLSDSLADVLRYYRDRVAQVLVAQSETVGRDSRTL